MSGAELRICVYGVSGCGHFARALAFAREKWPFAEIQTFAFDRVDLMREAVQDRGQREWRRGAREPPLAKDWATSPAIWVHVQGVPAKVVFVGGADDLEQWHP